MKTHFSSKNSFFSLLSHRDQLSLSSALSPIPGLLLEAGGGSIFGKESSDGSWAPEDPLASTQRCSCCASESEDISLWPLSGEALPMARGFAIDGALLDEGGAVGAGSGTRNVDSSRPCGQELAVLVSTREKVGQSRPNWKLKKIGRFFKMAVIFSSVFKFDAH